MKKIVFFLFLSLQMAAQEQSLRKGMVIDSLKVSDTLDESFSLYLPMAFKGQEPWPVLFLFDEQGRGKTVAQLFKSAAEDQGYILASSNDISSHKPLVKNVEIAARLLTAVSEMLPIDYNQISTAGSMDGAKVATSVPLLFDNIHGVIAVGNQWINFDVLDRKKNFSFIGVVGDEQYTASGMSFTADQLSRLKFPSIVYTYEGNEDWPTPEIISTSVGSLTLNAMKQELRPVDPELVDQLYSADLARVNKLISLQKLIAANNLLDIMREKYEGLRSTSEVRNRQDQIQRSRNFVQQQFEYQKAIEKEERLMDDFIYYMDQDLRTANFENLGWWNYQKNQLDSLAQKGGPEGKLANRLKGFILELAGINEQQLEKDHAPLEPQLLVNMLQTIFDPADFDSYKEVISLSAMDNDFGTALFYLEEMLKHGYDNKEELYSIEGTLGLRLTKDYNWLIEKYLGSARFHETNPEK